MAPLRHDKSYAKKLDPNVKVGDRLTQRARRILVSTRIFALSTALLTKLRKIRHERGTDDITQTYDAFMLDPGMGPPTYLSSDGRMIWDDDIWDVAGTWANAFAGIQVGSRKTGVLELRDLLPQRPSSAVDCGDCDATGWFDAHGQLKDIHGKPYSLVCPKCAGLGWNDPSVVLTDSVLGAG